MLRINTTQGTTLSPAIHASLTLAFAGISDAFYIYSAMID